MIKRTYYCDVCCKEKSSKDLQALDLSFKQFLPLKTQHNFDHVCNSCAIRIDGVISETIKYIKGEK